MDEIMKMLQDIQKDLAQQKQDMKNMEESIKETINKNINERFDHIETKTNQLEQKIETQQKTIDYLDKQSRKNNLLFFGIPETERGHEDLLNLILDFINNKMDVVFQVLQIGTAIRRGRKHSTTIRPVVVTFTTTNSKIQILKNKRKLENTGIYIKEDYTPTVLQKRKELQEELQYRRLSGEKVMLRHDKIITLKPKNNSTPNGPSKKRQLPESPENKSRDENNIIKSLESREQTKQAPKKNKHQNIKHFLRPSQLNAATNLSVSRENQEPPKN